MLKNWKVQEIGGAVALLICGLVLLLMPELTLVTIANVIGILVIIIGAFFLIGYFLRKELAAGNNDLIKGLVIVCIGIFICVKSELVVSVFARCSGNRCCPQRYSETAACFRSETNGI